MILLFQYLNQYLYLNTVYLLFNYRDNQLYEYGLYFHMQIVTYLH